jgi:hypothetical protein
MPAAMAAGIDAIRSLVDASFGIHLQSGTVAGRGYLDPQWHSTLGLWSRRAG